MAFQKAHSGRVRIYRVPLHALFDIIVSKWSLPDVVRVYSATNVPADAKIHDWLFDHFSKCAGFMVEHPSFDYVPDGGDIPKFGLLETEFTDIPVDKAGSRAMAYESLVAENVMLRSVFGDLIEDNAVVRSVWNLAIAEAAEKCASATDTDRILELRK